MIFKVGISTDDDEFKDPKQIFSFCLNSVN